MSDKNDTFLENRMARYDQWLDSGKVSFSSKVIPIHESVDTRQWVLPTDQVLDILQASDPIGLTECVCRSHYRRCDHPLDVCLVLNSVAAKEIEKNQARAITIDVAVKILKNANKRGLVHLSFYMPGPEIYALCSCCDCCCHDLQILKKYQRPDLVVRSDFIAVDDPEKCVQCGVCVQRCIFNARWIFRDKLMFDSRKCFGCGLCSTTCPTKSIEMRPV